MLIKLKVILLHGLNLWKKVFCFRNDYFFANLVDYNTSNRRKQMEFVDKMLTNDPIIKFYLYEGISLS